MTEPTLHLLVRGTVTDRAEAEQFYRRALEIAARSGGRAEQDRLRGELIHQLRARGRPAEAEALEKGKR